LGIRSQYGLATDSRIDKIIGLLCRIMALLQGSFTKGTYNLIDPTNRSHPVVEVIASHVAVGESRHAATRCIILQHTSTHPARCGRDFSCSVLQCVAVCCSVLQCAAVCCSALWCVAVCCSVLQCVAVCCSVLQVLQCAAVWCSVLQCVAVCRSVLHCVAVCCSFLQFVEVFCSVLQCVAVCCIVL